MSEYSVGTVSGLVAANMRRLREARVKPLQDVAEAAKELGVGWDRSTISRIETGKRELTVDECVALPRVLSLAFGEAITLADLLTPAGDPAIAKFDSFGWQLPLGEALYALAEPLFTVFDLSPYESAKKHVCDTAATVLELRMRQAQVSREETERLTREQEIAAVARELGATEAEVRAAYTKLWGGSSLRRTREVVLTLSEGALSNPARVRTMRGHATRQLMDELRREIHRAREASAGSKKRRRDRTAQGG